MTWTRKAEDFTGNKGMQVTDDDGDFAQLVKDHSRGVLIYVHSGHGVEADHHGIRLNERDARAVRRFLNEFLGNTEDDEDDEEMSRA